MYKLLSDDPFREKAPTAFGGYVSLGIALFWGGGFGTRPRYLIVCFFFVFFWGGGLDQHLQKNRFLCRYAWPPNYGQEGDLVVVVWGGGGREKMTPLFFNLEIFNLSTLRLFRPGVIFSNEVILAMRAGKSTFHGCFSVYPVQVCMWQCAIQWMHSHFAVWSQKISTLVAISVQKLAGRFHVTGFLMRG